MRRRFYCPFLGLWAVLALVTLPQSQAADNRCGPDAPRITVSGLGQLEVDPDLAYLNFGAEARHPEPRPARDEIEQAVRRFIEAAMAQGIAEADIKASGITLEAEYEYHDNQRVLTGYRARREIEVKTADFSQIGILTDLAVNSGLNAIGGYRYALSEPKSWQRQSARLSIADALEKANLLSEGLHFSLGKPCRASFEDGGFGPRMMPMMAVDNSLRAAKGEEASGIYTPGKLTVETRVNIEFPIE